MFFKTLPSEKIQRGYPCPSCGKEAERGIESFMTVGTQHGGQEVAASFAMPQADIGGRMRPIRVDNNGQVHEVKTSKDIDAWMRDNQLGNPRMTEWKNPMTGRTSMVPMRTRMIADPVSGEPLDVGAVVRQSEKMIPLDKKEPPMPSFSKTGRPMKDGVLTETDPRKIKSRYVDPETRLPMTMADLWGGESGVPDVAAKRMA